MKQQGSCQFSVIMPLFGVVEAKASIIIDRKMSELDEAPEPGREYCDAQMTDARFSIR